MQKLYRNEQKIFIPGPSGRLEAQVTGILPHLESEMHIQGKGTEAQVSRDAMPRTVGIICHPHPLYQGTMHNKVITTLVRAWQALGFATIRFNFRGVGESEGQYGDVIGEIDDLKAVIQWLKEQKAQSSQPITQSISNFRLCLAGFSFGSLVSAKVAVETREEVSLLLSIAPVVNHFQLLQDHRPTCPWLVIQGENDEFTSAIDVQQWFDNLYKNYLNQSTKLMTIPGATHFFHGKLIELQKEIEEGTCVLLASAR